MNDEVKMEKINNTQDLVKLNCITTSLTSMQKTPAVCPPLYQLFWGMYVYAYVFFKESKQQSFVYKKIIFFSAGGNTYIHNMEELYRIIKSTIKLENKFKAILTIKYR